MWINVVTVAAVGWVCALYVWEAYEWTTERNEPPQQPRPMENAGWDSILELKTSEFQRET